MTMDKLKLCIGDWLQGPPQLRMNGELEERSAARMLAGIGILR